MTQAKHFLFSYGTLQLDKVQTETYGRLLQGKKDCLLKYKLDQLKITDTAVLSKSNQQYHLIAVKTGKLEDAIEGTMYELTEKELRATDKYEVGDYQRVLEVFASGQQAWVYIAKQPEQNVNNHHDIAHNIDAMTARIKKACQLAGRAESSVRLLLATKTVSSERIKQAFEHGQTLIAENKVQEIKQKYNQLKEHSFEQHFIGHLQTNKVKEILKYNICCIQSLDRISLAHKLQQRLELEGKTMNVFVQVNTSNEDSKFGVNPKDALSFIKQVAKLNRLKIKGLMTIGLPSTEKEKTRQCFQRLVRIQQAVINENIPNVAMTELSMGMSGDLDIAIEEGATIVRVGTAVFGQRQ